MHQPRSQGSLLVEGCIQYSSRLIQNKCNKEKCLYSMTILLHEKFLQFDRLRAVVFQLNLKYLHVKITNLPQVVV